MAMTLPGSLPTGPQNSPPAKAANTVSTAVLLVAGVVVSSMFYEALVAFSLSNSFDLFWSKAGAAAAKTLHPPSGSIRLAVLFLAFVVVVTPLAWATRGGIRFLRRRARGDRSGLYHFVGGLSLFCIASVMADPGRHPALLGTIVLISLALSVVMFRQFSVLAKVVTASILLATILVAPPIAARLSTPRLDENGKIVGNLMAQAMFEPGQVDVMERVTAKDKTPYAVLGLSPLGDLVVVDICAAKQSAIVLPRRDFQVSDKAPSPCS